MQVGVYSRVGLYLHWWNVKIFWCNSKLFVIFKVAKILTWFFCWHAHMGLLWQLLVQKVRENSNLCQQDKKYRGQKYMEDPVNRMDHWLWSKGGNPPGGSTLKGRKPPLSTFYQPDKWWKPPQKGGNSQGGSTSTSSTRGPQSYAISYDLSIDLSISEVIDLVFVELEMQGFIRCWKM